MTSQKYWITVISKEHTEVGVNGKFMQACHGKKAPLQRIRKDDWIIIYSPKLTMEGNEKCQSFTAIGQAIDDDVYSFKMNENFVPFRRNIEFHPCKETSILPLIEKLEFIQNKKSWGYPFRFGFFEINRADFKLITSKMLDHEE